MFITLTKDKNISQITKNFSNLKIKSGRKGPSTSATIYNNNIYKIGINLLYICILYANFYQWTNKFCVS